MLLDEKVGSASTISVADKVVLAWRRKLDLNFNLTKLCASTQVDGNSAAESGVSRYRKSSTFPT